ncbi:MAG: hypothetical protein KAQ94_08630 [Arcobacteraceae bacterium]|nr:hypothetical protein [Arcobacteraceae bacterium]
MDLEELKRIRKANIKAHKEKKKAYYLKKKLEKMPKTDRADVIDYEQELFSGNFLQKIKEIAKKQKYYVDDRKDIITAKIQEYREKKQQYYLENKKQRLEYDKQYREKKKEDLKAYRKEYYKKNKAKILAKQKESRIAKAENGI